MKLHRLAFLAVLVSGASAAASPAGDIAGTWECRQPGVQYNNKPPILYVADNPAGQVSVEVDGFAREIFGRSEITADPSGWWKVKPAQGQEFMIRPEAGSKQRTPAMGLRWADSKSDYRCLRLPPSGAQSTPPTGPESVQPSGTLNIPSSGEQSVPPSGVPSEGPEKKE